MTRIQFRWIQTLRDIPKAAWDALAEPLPTPFLEWDWLQTLEETGCVGGETGWVPCHLTGWQDETLVAAAPLYLKMHSWGEFVFDQVWARTAMAYKWPYYPKLIGMSPFTPVPGYQFLIAPDQNRAGLQAAMLEVIDTFCQENGITGFHLLHIDPTWEEELQGSGLHSWLHYGLVWRNQNHQDFDGYLASFRSHRRKTIRRERRRLEEVGLRYRYVAGEGIGEDDMDAMFGFYADTCAKYWGGSQYLNHQAFRKLAQTFSRRLVLMTATAEDYDQPLAMSLLVRKADRLFGRYWGCHQDIDGLHFETCYYQPIHWAIDAGITSYDAGSGGAQHKQRRGFLPEKKYSLHRLYHPGLEQLWQQHLPRFNQETAEIIQALTPTPRTP